MRKSSRPRTRRPRTERLAVRVERAQSDLIRAAAEAAAKSVTDFIVESACAAAESALIDRRDFSVPEKKWRQFLQLLDRPASVKPRLRRLFSEPTVLDRRK